MNRQMKETSIPGIDVIPNNWDTCPMKTIFSFGKGLSITKDDLSEEGLPVLSYGQIHSKNNPKVTTPPEFLRHIPVDKAKKQSLTNLGDFIFADTSEDREGCGNCNYVDADGIYAGYHTIIAKAKDSVENKYFGYLFLTDAWRFQIRRELTEVKLYSVSQKVLKNTVLLLPPAEERKHIVSFLDRKCSAIDSAIEKTKESIEKLEEYKKAVITKAVTKGLNPDAKMKDSGIEWIGEVPEGWEVKRLRMFYGRRIHKNKGLQEKNLLSLSYGNVIRKSIDTKEGLLPESFDGYNIVEKGDIVIRGTDLQNDHRSLRTGLVTERGIITSAYMTLMPVSSEANSEYFHYLLHCYDVEKVFYAMGGGLRQGLDFWEFSRMMVIEPPKAEQDAIVQYINDKCRAIDALIKEKQTVIDKWTEYKKSLIYYAITGKIDCRNEVCE